jgi:4-amino-4-deoxy-L-arabinose transferase-like glycosyltransferase
MRVSGDAAATTGRDGPLPWWMQLSVGILCGYHLVYHAVYLRDVPFAAVTFSDGRIYENAARDILAAPPLGTEPFWLQGAYAYFMAGAMAPWPETGIAPVLFAQLLVAAAAVALFYLALARWLDAPRAAWATLALLACPALAFYENKFVTAELTVFAEIATIAAVAGLVERASWWRCAVVGVALALAVLVRPNLALAVPFVAVAAVALARPKLRTTGVVAALGLGLALGLAPMALRNLAVAGTPTVMPAHGGGTSFYIGNNQHARGVWNSAGGLLSGDVAGEVGELAPALGLDHLPEHERARAVGRALYRRALHDIAGDPARWLGLEARKLWLLVGNEELSQDYDVRGEQELIGWAHRAGLPFGVLVALGLAGALRLRRPPDRRMAALGWVLAGLTVATVGANLAFFTSAQHRLPLVVPLAVLAPLGARELARAIAAVRARRSRRAGMLLVAVALVIGQAAVPRTSTTGPSAVHYYNLAVAYDELGEPAAALRAIERALELRPDQPRFVRERDKLARVLAGTPVQPAAQSSSPSSAAPPSR